MGSSHNRALYKCPITLSLTLCELCNVQCACIFQDGTLLTLPHILSCIQWLLNAAARVVSGTGKFDRGLTQLRRPELQWLDVPEYIEYQCKLGVTVHWGL